MTPIKVALADLKLDPENVRRHPDRNIEDIKKSLLAYGQQTPINIDADGMVLKGNGTLMAAQALGWPDLWCVRSNLRGDAARAYAIADNATGLSSEWDDAALLKQLQALPEVFLPAVGFDAEEIEALASAPVDDLEIEDVEDLSEVLKPVENPLFPSSSKFGIPDLIPEMLSDFVPTDVYGGGSPIAGQLCVYGSASFDERFQDCVLSFYVDDYRFESVWSDAVKFMDKVRKVGWRAVASPDFSLWRDDPLVVQLWNIYRSRWCARYWQGLGIKVIPSLNWSDERSFEFALDGIPKNPPVVSCQCRTTRTMKGKELFIAGIGQSISRLNPGSVLIYGGVQHEEWINPHLPDGPAYVWLDSWMSKRKSARTKETAQ